MRGSKLYTFAAIALIASMPHNARAKEPPAAIEPRISASAPAS